MQLGQRKCCVAGSFVAASSTEKLRGASRGNGKRVES